jgi:hypothetical protein
VYLTFPSSAADIYQQDRYVCQRAACVRERERKKREIAAGISRRDVCVCVRERERERRERAACIREREGKKERAAGISRRDVCGRELLVSATMCERERHTHPKKKERELLVSAGEMCMAESCLYQKLHVCPLYILQTYV